MELTITSSYIFCTFDIKELVAMKAANMWRFLVYIEDTITIIFGVFLLVDVGCVDWVALQSLKDLSRLTRKVSSICLNTWWDNSVLDWRTAEGKSRERTQATSLGRTWQKFIKNILV
jgi:hypothetical protein